MVGNSMKLREQQGVTMLVFPEWEKLSFLTHGMSTRHGGVSTGIYATMNFKEDGEDTQENIRENYRRIAKALGCDVNRIVRPCLVHGNHVHLVTEEDYGNGALHPSTLADTDALITAAPGVTLCATYADCVPLFFVDTQKKAIGLAHSGWRGTVKKIGLETVKAMQESFGSRPEDILAAVGPCICGDCYEVGEEVAAEFKKAFGKAETEQSAVSEQLEQAKSHILRVGKEGKYQLDLRRANEAVFLEAGILPEHITISDVCTCCNPELLFSHRATKGKRGALGAFLGLRE